MKTLKSLLKKGAWQSLVSICLAALLTSSAVAEPLNYRLKWLFNASVVGDIYADVHGYFKEAGLDITVKPGGPERDAIKELELGLFPFLMILVNDKIYPCRETDFFNRKSNP